MIRQAARFAKQAHEGKMRKGTAVPYIVHPMDTGVIVSRMTDDPEVISAALLHDIARPEPKHPETGAGWLRELGYPEHGFTGTPAELLNAFNARLPALAAQLPRCAVVSAAQLPSRGDGLHFDTPSLRIFGLRYLEAYRSLA